MTDENTNTDLLVPIELDEKQAVAMFTKPDEFDALFAKIKEQADNHKPDTSTAKGRDAIASLAYKVTRTKTTLDNLGKKVKEDAQKTVNAVDATRKKMRDDLDALKTTVRQPLTDYEQAEQSKDDAVNADINALADLKNVPFDATPESIEAMQAEVQKLSGRNDWRGKEEKAADLIDACQNIHRQAHQAAIERARLAEENERMRKEQQRRDEEQRLRDEKDAQERRQREIEEQAKREAEAAQTKRIADLEREKQEAENRAAESERRAKQDRIDAAERAEREKREAEQRAAQQKADDERIAKEVAEAKARDEARQKKLADEKEARIMEAKTALLQLVKMTDETAYVTIAAIAAGNIPHVSFT